MDKVIFSEGKNDVLLLSTIHETLNTRSNYNSFINQDAEIDQTARLTHHRTGSEFEYLYKAEGGRSEVIRIFARTVVHLCDFDFDLTILVDLDGEPLSVFQSELDSEFVEVHRNRVRIEYGPIIAESSLIKVPCKILIQNSIEGEFNLLAYAESLEDETGIVDGEDDPTKIAKINQYISENGPHIDLISETLFD